MSDALNIRHRIVAKTDRQNRMTNEDLVSREWIEGRQSEQEDKKMDEKDETDGLKLS